MSSPTPSIEPVINQLEIPAGMAGPEPVTIEARSFVVVGAGGVVLVDAGPPGSAAAIEAALARVGAAWSDVTDIVLTHRHFDHVGGLADAAALAPRATIHAGSDDAAEIPPVPGRTVRPLAEGDRVGELLVLLTPGHTPGHVSLLYEPASLVVIGDLVGSADEAAVFGPAPFTTDPSRNPPMAPRSPTPLPPSSGCSIPPRGIASVLR